MREWIWGRACGHVRICLTRLVREQEEERKLTEGYSKQKKKKKSWEVRGGHCLERSWGDCRDWWAGETRGVE